MTFGDELSLTHCSTSHFKLFFQNVKSVDFNKGYGFRLLIWVMGMSKSSLSRPMLLSIYKVSIMIYHDLLRFYEKIYIFAITLVLIKISSFCLKIWGLCEYISFQNI